ncbi:MAG: ATP-binding protein [Victivallales bacterium]|nr:ATP-binding protein [Victivallales bacterium]
MLISLSIDNCLVFDTETEFSLQANMQSRRFAQNIVPAGKIHVVKSAIVIGPNNSGKTNLVMIFKTLKNVLLNTPVILKENLFSTKTICSLSVTFSVDDHEYVYAIKHDTATSEYVYERFSQVLRDKYGNRKEVVWLLRDGIENKNESKDRKLTEMMELASKRNLLMHALDTSRFPTLDTIKRLLTTFASSIDVIDMNNIPLEKTVEMMKANPEKRQKIADFVKNADLFLQDYKYLNDDEFRTLYNNYGAQNMQPDKNRVQEVSIRRNETFIDKLHLVSVYKGIQVPSIIFDSTGTKKLAALASYVLDALEQGRILVIDELDNSLHFKLTREIIAMFNNEMNQRAQLIATVHDVSLLDCRTLFRKEQIWFSHKDSEHAYLYSLGEFSAGEDGIRETTDLIEKYKRGLLGALPKPDLFNSLYDACNISRTSTSGKED